MCACDKKTVLWALYSVWFWFDENTSEHEAGNGVADPGPTNDQIDDIADLPGCAAAMEKVGWLERNESRVVCVNWGEHNSGTAKHRMRNQKRMQHLRGARSAESTQKVHKKDTESTQKVHEMCTLEDTESTPHRRHKHSKYHCRSAAPNDHIHKQLFAVLRELFYPVDFDRNRDGKRIGEVATKLAAQGATEEKVRAVHAIMKAELKPAELQMGNLNKRYVQYVQRIKPKGEFGVPVGWD